MIKRIELYYFILFFVDDLYADTSTDEEETHEPSPEDKSPMTYEQDGVPLIGIWNDDMRRGKIYIRVVGEDDKFSGVVGEFIEIAGDGNPDGEISDDMVEMYKIWKDKGKSNSMLQKICAESHLL